MLHALRSPIWLPISAARWEGRLGGPGPAGQGSESAQGRPFAARARSQAPVRAWRHAKPPWRGHPAREPGRTTRHPLRRAGSLPAFSHPPTSPGTLLQPDLARRTSSQDLCRIPCPHLCRRIQWVGPPEMATRSSLEQAHPPVMLLVPWKRLILAPPLLFQIGNDVQPRRRGSLVAPKFARLLNARKVMPQPAVAHPVGRLARELIQPAMHLFKRLSQHGCRFRAVLWERRHFQFEL